MKVQLTNRGGNEKIVCQDEAVPDVWWSQDQLAWYETVGALCLALYREPYRVSPAGGNHKTEYSWKELTPTGGRVKSSQTLGDPTTP